MKGQYWGRRIRGKASAQNRGGRHCGDCYFSEGKQKDDKPRHPRGEKIYQTTRDSKSTKKESQQRATVASVGGGRTNRRPKKRLELIRIRGKEVAWMSAEESGRKTGKKGVKCERLPGKARLGLFS